MTFPPIDPNSNKPYREPRRTKAGMVFIIAGILILLLSLVAYFRPGQSSGIVPPRLNQPLSNFQLADLAGNWVNLSDYAGQVVLINTWATWCPPCRAEMPDLNTFYNQFHEDGFTVLAINAGEAPAIAAEFAQEYSLDFPVLVDPDYRVMDGLKINTYPTSIIIDKKGVIRDIRVGVHSPQTLAEAVLPLLSE